MADSADDLTDREVARRRLAAATARADEAERKLAARELHGGAELFALATEELQRSERVLRAIFGGASDAMLLLDDEGRFVDANPAACAALKLNKRTLLRRGLGDFADDGPAESNALFAAMKASGEVRVRRYIRTALGERRTVDMSAVANIGPRLHLVVARDITDERAAAESLAWTEEELRRSDARFRAMVEKSAEVIALLSADGQILYITRRARDLFGVAPAQMVGTSALSWIAKEDRGPVAAAVGSGATTGSQIEFRVAGDGGEVRWVEGVVTNLLHDPAIAAIVVNAREVTARRRAALERDKLIESLTFERARLGTLLQQAPAFMAVQRGEDLVYELANDAYHEIVGRREVLGRSMVDALPELSAQGYIDVLRQVWRTGIPYAVKGVKVDLARGGEKVETLFADFIVQPLVEPNGTVTGVFTHGVNVTEETVAQVRLRDQFNGVPVPLYAWQCVVADDEPDFFLRDFNNAAAASSPGQLPGLVGKSVREIFPGDEVAFDDFMRCLGQGDTFQREVERGPIGSTDVRRMILTYAPAPPDVVLVHAEDVTGRRRLEEQLRQAQKMEAVGRLAGGVAHDFNNLLSVVLSYTGLAIEELAPGDPIRDDLQQVKHAGERAVELTRQLLAFSRQQVLQPRGMSVREAVLGLEKMLRRLLGEHIELVLDLASRGQVEADPGQMEQVIMNLVINARDAMPEGGTITLSTHDVEPSEQLLVEPPAAAKGPMTCLTVTDTGSGMSEATRAQIFEPFFTTKGAGKGTGLGLATVFGIVEQSGGSICVQSRERDESGEASGTSFRIYLPRVTRSEEMASVAPKAGPARGGTETILVVEDEAPLRALAVTVLRRAGYDVLEATDGADAVEVTARCRRPIHLLVTDVVMPRMNGRVLSDRLSADRPEMKVLFMSGYTDDAVVIQRVLASHVAFLQKPLTPATLLSKVRETLDGPGDGPRSSAAAPASAAAPDSARGT